jgi:hypothetical protein
MDFSQIILAFVAAVVLVYLVFWFYRYYKNSNVVYRQSEILVEGQHDATKSVIVDHRKIPLSVQGNEYTISFWIFIKDYNYRYGNTKTVLYRGDKGNKESNPFIYLHPNNNDMTIKVQLQTDTVDQNLKDMEQRAIVAAQNSGSNSNEVTVKVPNVSQESTPNLEDEPMTEGFKTVLPMGYFRQNNNSSGERYSNISGNEMEGFEDSIQEPATDLIVPATPASGAKPESLDGLDDRLDKVELQLQKIIGMKADSSAKIEEKEKQGQINSTTEVMPITYDECVIKNLPLQKWTHVAVSIFNNHVEVYLDGKLSKACSLKGFPKPSVQHMYVTADGGFNGYLANLEYSNMSITQHEVYADYLKGPNLVKGLGDKIGDIWSGVTSIFKNN